MPKGIYKHKKGKESNNWKGGIVLTKNNYTRLRLPNHPRANHGYVLEHIVVAEKALGKPLPLNAEIHHHGARNDNFQIVVCEGRAYHFLLHTRTRALRACGHTNWRKCWICKKYDRLENLTISKANVYHKRCAAKRERIRKEEK